MMIFTKFRTFSAVCITKFRNLHTTASPIRTMVRSGWLIKNMRAEKVRRTVALRQRSPTGEDGCPRRKDLRPALNNFAENELYNRVYVGIEKDKRFYRDNQKTLRVVKIFATNKERYIINTILFAKKRIFTTIEI